MHSAKGQTPRPTCSPATSLTSTSQQALYMQAAMLSRSEPHLKSPNAVGSRRQAKHPYVPDPPQSTRVADARTLAHFPDPTMTFVFALVSPLHDSMSSFEQSGAETSTSLVMTRGRTVVGSSTTSDSERWCNVLPAVKHFTTKMHSHITVQMGTRKPALCCSCTEILYGFECSKWAPQLSLGEHAMPCAAFYAACHKPI